MALAPSFDFDLWRLTLSQGTCGGSADLHARMFGHILLRSFFCKYMSFMVEVDNAANASSFSSRKFHPLTWFRKLLGRCVMLCSVAMLIACKSSNARFIQSCVCQTYRGMEPVCCMCVAHCKLQWRWLS